MMRTERRSPFQSHKLLFACIFLLFLAAVCFLAAYSLRIRKITVSGSYSSDAKKIETLVFREEEDYRLYRVLYRSVRGIPADGVFSSLKIRPTGLTSCEIEVRENEAKAVILHGEEKITVDQNGTVFGPMFAPDADIPVIKGLPVKSSEELKILDCGDEQILKDALTVVEVVGSCAEVPEEIFYTDGSFALEFDDVTVVLGSAAYLTQKISILNSQFPYYEGLKGTLHMEDFDGNEEAERFYFEVEE